MARGRSQRAGIDLNTASREALLRIEGIDGTRADMLLRNRPYRSWRDVEAVDGIGRVLARKIRRSAILPAAAAGRGRSEEEGERSLAGWIGLVGIVSLVVTALGAAAIALFRDRTDAMLPRTEPSRRAPVPPRPTSPNREPVRTR